MSTKKSLAARLLTRAFRRTPAAPVRRPTGPVGGRIEELEDRTVPAFAEFVDPNPNPGNQFGATVLPLSTGNVVVTSAFDDAGGTDAGAVYLFNGSTGALISTLVGTTAGDNVGNFGVVALSNGNYVVLSPNWDNGGAFNAGAVTFGNGTTGVAGAVSAANSLVGTTSSNQVGNNVVALSNGNYVVLSPFWDNGVAANAGAATFGSGTTGVAGAVSAANSLVGTTAGDFVGIGGVVPLSNGNYVVLSASWDNGGVVNAGAATFGSGTTGVAGAVSAANSLVGTTAGDNVGNNVVALSNGNYVVRSPNWDNGGAFDAGAATFGSGTTGVAGAVSAANSLVGTTAGDNVGSNGVVALSNGNYVVRSTIWDNGGAVDAGAATFGSGTTGVAGAVSAANSLVGTTAGDRVGNTVVALSNGNYVVAHPSWDNGGVVDAGAATFGSGTTGVAGAVSAANSLVGTTAGDSVSIYNVVALSNGNYMVLSANWDNGGAVDAGAATFGSGTTGVAGAVSAANSLVGTTAGDSVGNTVVALSNGNYVVANPFWDNGGVVNAGAATFGSGTTGVAGAVSAANSLVGTTASDQVGGSGVVALSNGNYVVRSPFWDNGGVVNAGAATFGSGTTGVAGAVSAANSLVGTTAGDFVGSGGVVPLSNGNYVVRSPSWVNGGVVNAGAATFGSGTTGVAGAVSAANSLVGTTAGDFVGIGGVVALSNGNYVVRSTIWDNGGAVDAGAATFGSGTTGVAGAVSAANSLVGTTAGDSVGNTVVALSNGNYVVLSASWDNGGVVNAGAATFGSGTTGVSGPITAANSAIGTSANTNLQSGVPVDPVNDNFYPRFLTETVGGRVRVGSQTNGFTTGTVTAALDGSGNLIVTDADGTRNNAVTVSVASGALTIADAAEQFVAAPSGWVLSGDRKSISRPLTGFTGSIALNLAGGNDSVTLDYAAGQLPDVSYDGGTGGNDSLVLSGGATTTQTFNFTNAHDGSVVLSGTNAGTITYTGLEPVSSTLTSANVVLNYSTASETISVQQYATAPARTQVTSSTAAEAVDFVNPTDLLEINAGDTGDDVVNVNGFGTSGGGFTATLAIDGGTGTDLVDLNAAITYASDKNLTVLAETITVDAAQVLSGTGTVTLTAGRNIAVSANITGGTGGTTLLANGVGATTDGVLVQSGAVVTATGSGNVSVTGTGGSANFTSGVYVTGTGSAITSDGGSVTVQGNGGTGAATQIGVRIYAGGTITSGNNGNVSVTGVGGGSTGQNNNLGVYVDVGGTITSHGSGTVTVHGTGGSNGVGSHGIYVNSNAPTVSLINSGGSGAVKVTGIGGGSTTGGSNYGVYVGTGGSSSAARISSGGGDVTVQGTGGSGSGNINYGVYVFSSAQITSSGGAVLVKGTGGGAGSSSNNYGVHVRSGGVITSAGTGSGATVTVEGQGGNTTGTGGDNYGVRVIDTNAQITSSGGAVRVTGTGGGAGSSSGNDGVYVRSGGVITSAGTGSGATVTVEGQGGNTTGTGGDNYGVRVIDTNAQITSSGGAVRVTGTGGGAGSSSGNDGVYVRSGGVITSAGTGSGATVTVEGQGGNTTGTGGGNLGVHLVGTGTQITSSGGAVRVTGTGGGAGSSSSNWGVLVQSGGVITSAGTGSGATVTVEGQGGNTTGTGGGNLGVHLVGTGTQITSSGGAVRVTGTAGGAGSGSNNYGVFVQSGGVITSAGTGSGATVTVEGQGGNTTGYLNHGVVVFATGAQITSSGGAVLVTGTGGGAGSGSDNIGVVVDSSGTLSSGAALTVNGTKGVNTTDGILTVAGTTVTAVGVATLNGLGGSDITSAKTITGGTGVVIDSGGATSLSGAVSATTGTIGITTGTSLTTSGSGTLTATGAGGAITTSSQTTLTVGAAVSALGGVQLTFGQDNSGRTAGINAAVNGSSATVTGGTGSDTVTVTATGTTILDVNGGGVPTSPSLGFDQVTAVLGALGTGFVQLNNPVGPTENYHATVDGAALATALAFHANDVADHLGVAIPGASGPRRVAVPIGASTTVLDYRPAGGSLTVLSLLGGTGGDTYSVQFTDPAVVTPANSLLPPLVNVTADSASDTAHVYGTNSPDTFGVNQGDNDRVTSAGVTVQYDGNLETMTVYGKDEPNAGPPPIGNLGDTFDARPDVQTRITLVAGTPTLYVGDTLNLDLANGLNLLNPTFNPTGNALPDGNLTLTGGGFPAPPTAALSWTGVENFPVPKGLGGTFDMGPVGSPVPFGFTAVNPGTAFTMGTGYGWTGPAPQYGYQAFDAGTGTAVGAGDPVYGLTAPLGQLLRDYVYGWNTPADVGYFRVEVAPGRPVQVTTYLGAPTAIRDNQVVEWGVTNNPAALPTAWAAFTTTPGGNTYQPGEMGTVGGLLTGAMIGTNRYLVLRFTDIGSEPYWSVSGVDVRPAEDAPGQGGLIAPLLVTRAFSTDGAAANPPVPVNAAMAAVPADGFSIDYYTGTGAIPNSVVTVTVTNGAVVDSSYVPASDNTLSSRVLDADGFAYTTGFQVQAAADGTFSFGVRRPTGTATSTVTATDYTGQRMGRFTQPFALPTARRVDFGPAPVTGANDYGNDGQVEIGYAPFGTATYTSTAANALGWVAATTTAFTPAGTGATSLTRDGVFGGYAPSEFVADMPQTPGTEFVVTLALGDLAARRDDLFVEVPAGAGWATATGYNPSTNAYDVPLSGLTSPPGVSPNPGQVMARSFKVVSDATGRVRFRVGNTTGNPYWTLAGADIRPAPTALVVTPSAASAAANGTATVTYTVDTSGLAVGTLLTVRTGAGAVGGPDASPVYDGTQLAVTGATLGVVVTAPTSATTLTSYFEAETTSGSHRGQAGPTSFTAVAPTVGTVRRFDFNAVAAGPTVTGWTAATGADLWTTGAPYGWVTANNQPIGGFDRGTAGLPASMTADQKDLFRDGVSLNATRGTFRVQVGGAGAHGVRYYVGDSARAWPGIKIQVEGQAGFSQPVASTGAQLAMNVNRYWSYVLTGADTGGAVGVAGDGYLDVSIFGSNVWVLNGLDVAAGGVGSLPPSLVTGAPLRAADPVVVGPAAAPVRAAGLAPVVEEAIARWVAAGADEAALRAVSVGVADLGGNLGLHTPGAITLDDDAGGRGWFVDATPGDDAEFAGGVAVRGPAAGRVDLLTVVMHELGHAVGLDDDAGGDGVMGAALGAGVRRAAAAPPPAADPLLDLDGVYVG